MTINLTSFPSIRSALGCHTLLWRYFYLNGHSYDPFVTTKKSVDVLPAQIKAMTLPLHPFPTSPRIPIPIPVKHHDIEYFTSESSTVHLLHLQLLTTTPTQATILLDPSIDQYRCKSPWKQQFKNILTLDVTPINECEPEALDVHLHSVPSHNLIAMKEGRLQNSRYVEDAGQDMEQSITLSATNGVSTERAFDFETLTILHASLLGGMHASLSLRKGVWR
jgi:hypothetical protein